MAVAQPYDVYPDLSDSDLRLAALNLTIAHKTLGVDASAVGNDGTPAGKVCSLPVGACFDGVDDTIDFGDVGNVQQVSVLVKPVTATEQLFLIDTGAYVHIVAGVVTYVGLIEAATYVNNVATTTVVAGEWSMIVCQFTQVDANNFELGVDGAGNFGAMDVKDLRARDAVWSVTEVGVEYAKVVPDVDLILWTVGGMTDLSRFARALTRHGGVVAGWQMRFDGVDDWIDAGDVGNVQQVSVVIDPETTTEEILQIDAGKHITVSGGTVTYTGLTPVATYVNGDATTTLAADQKQHLVCQFERDAGANFELGREGANYGEITLRDVKARDAVWSVGDVKDEWERVRRFI